MLNPAAWVAVPQHLQVFGKSPVGVCVSDVSDYTFSKANLPPYKKFELLGYRLQILHVETC